MWSCLEFGVQVGVHESRKPVTSITCFVETCRGLPPVVIQGRTCAEQNAKLNRGFPKRAVVFVVELKIGALALSSLWLAGDDVSQRKMV